MLANNIAASNGRKAYCARLPRARDPVTACIADICKGNPAPLCSGFAEHDGCPRGGINLAVVMRLHNFNIEILIQRSGHLFGDLH